MEKRITRDNIRSLYDLVKINAKFDTRKWIGADEGEILRELIRLSSATQYFESGTANGCSALWAAVSLPESGVVHTFDPINRIKVWDARSYIKPIMPKISFHNEEFEKGIGKVLLKREDTPAAFFIDGDHSSGAIGREWEAIKNYLIIGDLIVFHDMSERGVGRAWQRILTDITKSKLKYRTFTFKTRRIIGAIFYGTDKIPAGDETEEPITVKIESEMDWDTEKVRDIPEWKNAEKPWVDYPDKALLSSSESHLLYDTAKRLGSGNYANLGTFKGASAAYMSLGLKQVGASGKIYAIDDYTLKALNGYPERMMNFCKDLGIDSYIEVCTGTTSEWGEKLKDVKFKAVFIDAGHRYEVVKEDFEVWGPLVEIGGELIFHDIEYTNVSKVLEEEVRSDQWEIVKHVWRTKVFKRVHIEHPLVKHSKWANEKKPWTVYPEKAMIGSTEAHFLYDTPKRLGPGNYANLGTFKGASAAYMAFGLKEVKGGGKIYTVDSHRHSGLEEFPERMFKHLREFKIAKYVEDCKGTTDVWAKKLKHLKFNFVFVDAGHEYYQVKKDFEMWSPLIKLDGEIAFHDIFFKDVRAVIDECVKRDWVLVQQVWNIEVFKRK